ncbi:Hypothetical protein NocV09_03600030 [Nannochloropsis oceanica]
MPPPWKQVVPVIALFGLYGAWVLRDRFDHHIVMREEIKEDRRRQKREARLETARRGAEAAATEEINKE